MSIDHLTDKFMAERHLGLPDYQEEVAAPIQESCAWSCGLSLVLTVTSALGIYGLGRVVRLSNRVSVILSGLSVPVTGLAGCLVSCSTCCLVSANVQWQNVQIEPVTEAMQAFDGKITHPFIYERRSNAAELVAHLKKRAQEIPADHPNRGNALLILWRMQHHAGRYCHKSEGLVGAVQRTSFASLEGVLTGTKPDFVYLSLEEAREREAGLAGAESLEDAAVWHPVASLHWTEYAYARGVRDPIGDAKAQAVASARSGA